MRDFKKYDIWHLAKDFSVKIYNLTSEFPREETYGISSQLRRAAVSIPTNISEGCGRNSDKEFANFINISLGSVSEVENLIIISSELDYIDSNIENKLIEDLSIIKKKTYSLYKTLKKL